MLLAPKGLTYWLNWIAQLEEWANSSPAGIYANPSYSLSDVPYSDLQALAAHFKLGVAPEGADHRQWLLVQVWHGMSATQVWFKSPVRSFTYNPLP